MIKQYNITDYIKDDPELQKAVVEEFLNDIKRLQAENKQLKKEIWQLQHHQMWDKEATLQAELLIKENKELKNIIKIHDNTKYDYYKLMKENEELKQALKEIRGTLKLSNDCILDIISEVLDERN